MFAGIKTIAVGASVFKFNIGTIEVWTCSGIVIAFKSGKHLRPIVWNGNEGSVRVAEYVIDMVDGKRSSRYPRKAFEKMFNIVLSAHNLH